MIYQLTTQKYSHNYTHNVSKWKSISNVYKTQWFRNLENTNKYLSNEQDTLIVQTSPIKFDYK